MPPRQPSLISLRLLTPLLHPQPTLLTPPRLRPPLPPVLRLYQNKQHYSTPPTPTPTPSPSPTSSPKPYTFDSLRHLSTSPSPTRLIIDVREPSELAETGRVPGAHSMPILSNPDAFYLDEGVFFERFGFAKPRARSPAGGGAKEGDGADGADGDGEVGEGRGEAEGGVEEVVFYCKAGVRSRAAARMAREWVGVRAGDMKGGWMEWEARGGEVER